MLNSILKYLKESLTSTTLPENATFIFDDEILSQVIRILSFSPINLKLSIELISKLFITICIIFTGTLLPIP